MHPFFSPTRRHLFTERVSDLNIIMQYVYNREY